MTRFLIEYGDAEIFACQADDREDALTEFREAYPDEQLHGVFAAFPMKDRCTVSIPMDSLDIDIASVVGDRQWVGLGKATLLLKHEPNGLFIVESYETSDLEHLPVDSMAIWGAD